MSRWMALCWDKEWKDVDTVIEYLIEAKKRNT